MKTEIHVGVGEWTTSRVALVEWSPRLILPPHSPAAPPAHLETRLVIPLSVVPQAGRCSRVGHLLATCMAISVSLAFGQNAPAFGQETAAPVSGVTDFVATNDEGGEFRELPTLTEVKAAGALRSTFAQQVQHDHSTEMPKPRLTEFREVISPILAKACTDCHGPETQEGRFRIDRLDPDLLHGADVDWWLEVVDVLSNGEMPPADEGELASDDRGKVIQWLSSEIQVASAVRRSEQGRSSFRRMTRYEYNHALQDLLGLPYDFAFDLPPETASPDGFQNSSEVLQMSAVQFAYFRELGRRALLKATVRGDRPPPIHWSISMEAAAARMRDRYDSEFERKKKQFANNPEKLQRELERHAARYESKPRGVHYLDLKTGTAFRASWNYRGAKYAWGPSSTPPSAADVSQHVAVIPAQQKLIVELGNEVPDHGTVRIRVRAWRGSPNDRGIPSLRLEFGFQASNNSSASARISGEDIAILASPEHPEFYQWEIPLSEIRLRNPMRATAQMGDTPNPSEYLKLHNSAASQADVQIDYVEVTAPVFDQWPPPSHARIFGEPITPLDEQDYAREVLSGFMRRAWRRDVTADEVDQKMKLLVKVLPECADLQEAMIEVLATVLSSPNFLYLTTEQRPDLVGRGRLSEYELATRLSMFLWSSVPDEELLRLAADGRLDDPETLRAQADRMIADPRCKRFAQQFVRQWLGMQLLDYLEVDKEAYPRFDSLLREAMQEEPIAFFQQVLSENHSVIDFLHADYAMINERLAQHYGITGVYGNQFQKVELKATDRRGGLLTQAGLLAMNSDGKDSHPLKRGIWLLERLLDDPPPPPPPAVPEIDLADPEIAKMTLKQRIEDHRNDPACMSCHAKIDPWGIAFENYDAVGSWRAEIMGVPVDASSLLFNRQRLDGMDGLKRFLLYHRQDQFARAIVHKLTTYALGRPLTFSDRSQIDKLTTDLRSRGDGLKTLVFSIVTSELFASK